VSTSPINFTFNSGDDIQFTYTPQFERLFESFEIARGVTLPVGDYRFTRWGLEMSTASKRRWQFDNAWSVGPFWSGHASQFDTGFQYKVAPHFQTGITLKQTFAHLAEGDFVARVLVLRGDYSVSPLLTFFTLVQFDNQGTSLGWQSRVRWTLRPGDDVLVVFSQGWLQDVPRGLSFRPTDTRIAGKVQ
jgi:hypothetical protein